MHSRFIIDDRLIVRFCMAILFFILSMSTLLASEIIKTTIVVFDKNDIHFTPDESTRYDSDSVTASDNGRVISRTVNIPDFENSVKIIAHLELHPIPKDEVSVCDPWDRAGNVRLSVENKPDIELIKFITSYGGYTEYDVDISQLAPLLKDEIKLNAFIDTWLSPAWKVDFSLTFTENENSLNPDWATPVAFVESYNTNNYGNNGREVEIDIPEGLKSVKLYYLISGHCTDGTDADEFVSKDNVFYIDDVPVFRYQPWRDDCKKVRAINPYTRRWSDGNWSSDYSRSGWCPGVYVEPLLIDLSDHLTTGRHKIKFVIEDVRPPNEKGDFGYWRMSSYLCGWKVKPLKSN